jgi:hypothetical protein
VHQQPGDRRLQRTDTLKIDFQRIDSLEQARTKSSSGGERRSISPRQNIRKYHQGKIFENITKANIRKYHQGKYSKCHQGKIFG